MAAPCDLLVIGAFSLVGPEPGGAPSVAVRGRGEEGGDEAAHHEAHEPVTAGEGEHDADADEDDGGHHQAKGEF
ncbi:hypothetical protein Rsph17029_2611 [Rhodobacter sphaeroides ATCC 17029]|nr:hypothetical protein Rsph17029_2611 [Cereibacter sphaeroides ATCC 17029]